MPRQPIGLSRRARAAAQRVAVVRFPILQTSVTSGLAWFLCHDLMHHRQPFFAPVSAAVCMSASNVMRAQRAVQMMIGVTLGIGIGSLVVELAGPGSVQIAVTVLLALVIGVSVGQGYIGQGLMFVNQTTVSAILVLALYRTGVGFERIFDAAIGGGLAMLVSVGLFPADPLDVLSRARHGVLGQLEAVLSYSVEVAYGRAVATPTWQRESVDHVHEQLGALIQARSTARLVAASAPRRWRLRDTVAEADRLAQQVAMFAGSVLQLARLAVLARYPQGRMPEPLPAAMADLAAAARLVEYQPAAATAYLAAARRQAGILEAKITGPDDVVLAGIVQGCVDDFQRLMDLRAGLATRRLNMTPRAEST